MPTRLEITRGSCFSDMEQTLKAAVEIAQAAEAHATARNYSLRFTSEDIRASFLGNRYRGEKLARCRQLLGMPASPQPSEESKDYRDRYEELTGSSLRECPMCHHGRMVTVAILLPSPNRQASITDTS